MTATGLALGASRTACYLAVSLVLGGFIFAAAAWRGAARATATSAEAEEEFARRFGALALAGCGLGVAGTGGLVALGHRAPGSGFWVLVEMVGWVAVGAFLLTRASLAERHEPDLPLGLACAAATLALVLAGRPTSAFVGALTLVHVVAAAAWVGGIAYLVLALPPILRGLEREEHARLLLETLSRFSPLALGSVIAIVLTGAVHAAAVLPDLADLWGSAFGRLVIVKSLLVLFLVGLGAINRNHVIPSLRAPGPARPDPRRIAVLARRTLAWEAVAMVAVLIASAGLVAAAPSSRNPDPYPYGHVDTRRSTP